MLMLPPGVLAISHLLVAIEPELSTSCHDPASDDRVRISTYWHSQPDGKQRCKYIDKYIVK